MKDLKMLDREIDKLVSAWKSGDTESMEATFAKSLSLDRRFSVIYDKLIYKKNGGMVAKIEGYLRAKRTYFVVIGAGHLLGDKGLLKDRGYSVEQL